MPLEFKHIITPTKKHLITWPTARIPRDLYNATIVLVEKTRNYNITSSTKDFCDFCNHRNLCNMRKQCVLSIAHIAIIDKAITRSRHIERFSARILMDYDGKNILHLANKYDFSPLSIMDIILANKHENNVCLRGAIKQLFSGLIEIPREISKQDCAQYTLALLNDVTSARDSRRIAEIAKKNEHKFVLYFREALKINLKTEEEIKNEQIENHGRAISTPDLLFTDDVFINNIKINWIDFKDYCGTPNARFAEHNTKQAKKYNNWFGQGAICYRHPIVDGFTITNTMLLDASILNIEFESAEYTSESKL